MFRRTLRTLALTAVVAGSTIAAAPASAHAASYFQTPSGNIACQYKFSTSTLRCDVASDDLGVTFNAYGKPRWRDTIGIWAVRTLHYGQHWRSRHFTCTSRVSGLRCVERHTGRGFVLARDGMSHRF